MKKTNKTIIAAGALAMFAATWGLHPASGHAMTLQDLDKTWGKPAVVVKADGIEKRYYKYQNTMDVGYRVFSIQGNEVIDGGLTGSAPQIAAAKPAGLPVSQMSKNFWSSHPTAVESIMGKPDSMRKLDDGSVEMFYKYAGTSDIGYRYFLVKDGQIVASGTTDKALTNPKTADAKATRTIYASTDYYQNHPTTVAAVDAAWGKPVAIKTLSNGLEERLYKYSTTLDVGYRFFLIKDGKVVASGTEG
jgi:hypothetical protein